MARKITPLKLNEAGVKAAIQADDAKRQARGVERRAAKAAAAQALKDQAHAEAEKAIAERRAAANKTASVDLEAVLASLRVDYDATMAPAPAIKHPEAFNAWLADQGYNPDGSTRVADDQPKAARERHYFGPMLALVEASKHYVKGTNGNPHCADALAMVLDGLTREAVVTLLGDFLFANKVTESSNPYKHLNPGQQSMNLRNKTRGALKNGLIKSSDLNAHVEAYKARSAATTTK